MPIDYTIMNQMLYDGKAPLVQEMAEQALAEGHPVEEVLSDGLIGGMSVVGEDFKHNRVYVPEVLIAARAMKSGMSVLKPLLADRPDVKPAGTLVMGTVKGDLHDIGKNLVNMMSEGGGFTVIDLGVDVSVDKFMAAAREHKADVVGMSALLTTTMVYMAKVIEAFQQEDDLKHIKMCIGGAPISPTYADEIGADGYAADAASAVDLFNEMASAPAGT